jgi:hypothetical protein
MLAWKQALVGCVKSDHGDTFGLLLPGQVRPKVKVAVGVVAAVMVPAKRDCGRCTLPPT